MDTSSANNVASSTATASTHRMQHMEVVTSLFEDDLVAAYEKDSSAEMLKQLTAALEIGAAVWGAPLLVDNRRASALQTDAVAPTSGNSRQ